MEHGLFKPEDVRSFVSNALPGFHPSGQVEELSGGNINLVWRVSGRGRSVIVKYAPPFIAKAPDIAIHPRRILMEAAALRLFNHPPLRSFLSEALRPPKLLHTDEKRYAIILEDVGALPTLDQATRPYHGLGAELGRFLAGLHATTLGDEAIAGTINNREIQQTRLEVQYAPVESRLKDAGVRNAAELGRRAEQLGRKYLTKGKCLTMGDLWPRSILVDNKKQQARLIDWEFAHYGRPAQDVAHFIAHLWMLRHRTEEERRKLKFRSLQKSFLESYMANLGPKKPVLFDEEEVEDAGIHFGAEILARTIGAFQEGYLYEGLAHDSPAIREAVQKAVDGMENGREMFDV